MFVNVSTGRRIAFAVGIASTCAMAPASAHAGFLDQLFGGIMGPQAPAPAPAQDPAYGSPHQYADPQQQDNFGMPRSRRVDRVVHPKKKVAQVDKTPTLQKTTDLMSDKTLRPGDAVMMKSGLHVYDGPQTSHHDADQFVAIDEADHLKPKTRDELAEIDVTRRNPLVFAASTSTMVEGRSVADRPAIVQGYKITDARGRSIRYVGP